MKNEWAAPLIYYFLWKLLPRCWPTPFFASTWRGANIPERPERFDAVVRGLRQAGLLERLAHVDPRAATEEELLLCHTPEYLQRRSMTCSPGARR